MPMQPDERYPFQPGHMETNEQSRKRENRIIPDFCIDSFLDFGYTFLDMYIFRQNKLILWQ